MRIRQFLILAAIACCAAPSAAASVGNGVIAYPTASTGNGVIAFIRKDDIWTLDLRTHVEQNLTGDQGPGVGGPLSWSPDGSHLVYSLFVPEGSPVGARRIPMVMSADGSSKHALVDDPGQNWSPECWLGSDLVALNRFPLVNGLSADYFSVRLDGSGLRQLTPAGLDPSRPSGAHEVCSAAAGLLFFPSALDFYSVETDGTLLKLPSGFRSVSPSPDGSQLAWMGGEALSVGDIDGTNSSKIADAPASSAGYVGQPQWSPDGSEIAFLSATPLCCSDEEPSYYSSVHVVSASGGGERALSSRPMERVTPLAWSPDGTRILFQWDRGFDYGTQVVFVMNADGSCRAKLYTAPSAELQQGIVWQPVSGKAADPPIYCADVGIAGNTFSQAVGLDGSPYSVEVTNEGNLSAEDVRVTFSDFVGVAFRSLQTPRGSCEATSCLIDTVKPGETITVTANVVSTNEVFSAHVRARFKAQVSSAGTNSDDSNDSLDVRMQAWGCPIGTEGPDDFAGTPGSDVFCALGGDDRISGLAGKDSLDGGAGLDFVDGGLGHDELGGGGGNDIVYAQDGQVDFIDCGEGDDLAIVDREDSFGRCEHVVEPHVACTRYARDDGGTLQGTSTRDELCGRAGDDTILGRAGNDSIDGGGGNDRIDGGAGRDVIYGGAGADRILAGDRARDTVDCGPGRDRVVADRLDRIAQNCESVLRKRP